MPGAENSPLLAMSDWLATTRLNHLLQTVEWLVPAIQTLHILCVALVICAAVMLALGTLGVYGVEQPLSRRYSRFLPVLRWGVPALLATGALMVIAEPDRALPNPVFQLKMVLIVSASVATALSNRRLTGLEPDGRGVVAADAALRTLAITALLLWTSVLVAGRWIAYTLAS